MDVVEYGSVDPAQCILYIVKLYSIPTTEYTEYLARQSRNQKNSTQRRRVRKVSRSSAFAILSALCIFALKENLPGKQEVDG